MNRLFTTAAALVGSLLAILIPTSVQAAATGPAKPNVIVILADDMGFSDLGCYGSEIPTPNLDQLAAHGLRFTQFYNTGRCCPSRAALLTGLYSHQTGVGHMVADDGLPGYQGHLNDSCVTLAEVLRPAGYFTAMAGKWHVGQEHGVVPWKRGFDRSLNAPAGGFYYPEAPRAELYLDGRRLANDAPELPKHWYTTDLWTDFGLRFIDEARAAKKPFFLYLAHNAPHFPLQAPDDEIAKFRGRYKVGWDVLREQRHARQIALGIMDKAWPLSPRPPAVKAWDSLTAEEQDRFDHIMAIYAACVAHLDTAVGRLVAALKERGELDNTLIVFLSDNGGNAEGGPNGTTTGEHLGDGLSTVYCGQSWATLENTPLRRYKHFNHEGGIASPLIVHWPAGIAARGELRAQSGHIIDLMATVVDVTGAEYPKEFHGHSILPLEGRSLRPAFANQALDRGQLFWEHEGNAAARVGDWKIARVGRKGAWELYNLANDRTELHDQAAAEPARLKELAALWEAWAERTHVIPYPTPNAPAPGAAKPKPKAKAKAAATSATHQTNQLEGWNVIINRRLLDEQPAATAKALELLQVQLQEIVRVVPAPAVKFLRGVNLWFSPEYPGVKPRAEFHPDAGWLKDNGRDPRMAKGVEFTDIKDFAAETIRMPNFTLHELAHAYHDGALPGGFENAEIRAAYERAKAGHTYDRVERWFGSGRPNTFERHYGMTNPMEYWAESTEAFFSRNDFYPFNRGELHRHDPEMETVLAHLWGVTQ